ncbi:TonB-dependent receptor [Phenylobacterium sp.]|uniref:TonB-dependent receptor n=1 Tax=Phenylobacterium sp. TaxID=1871053 RepID=UPI002DF445ED|nr:TonB-dependent receptor [Phenylobacterium sp.]
MAALVGATAHAQTRSGTTAAASNTIEELVVTAQKREQSLQDVPVAVSAFTSEKRDLIGVNTIADLTNFTPGLEYNAQNDRNTLRGVGRNTNVHAADGSVAQYSDGIYTSSTTEAGKTPLFVDRIEILRGPQGTLYGRNSIGGAINIISKRPTEDFYAEVRASLQNYSMRVIEGAVSGPTMIPGVEFRAGANWTKQTQGWFKNTVPGEPDEGNIIDTKYVEGQLKFKFNDNFDGWMKLAWQDWHNQGGGPGSRETWQPAPFPVFEAVNAGIVPTAGYACLPGTGVTNVIAAGGMPVAAACHNAALDDPRKFTSDVPYQVKLTGTMIFASEWNYHFTGMDLKYIMGGTAYNYALTGPTPVDQAPITSFTLPRVFPAGLVAPTTVVIPGGGPTVHPRYSFNYHEALNWYSHEINLASTDKGPLQWIGGLFYYDEYYVQPVYTTLQDQPAGTLAPGFLSNAVCNLTGGVCPAEAPNDRVYDDRPSLTTTSEAAFGQIDYQITQQFKTTLGLRYTHDHKRGQESLRLLCFDVTACGVAPELLGSNFVIDLSQPATAVLSGFTPGGPGSPGVAPGVSTTTTIDPATGFATRHYDQAWSATTGTFGLQWDPEPGTMAYFNYSRGFKAGGFRIGIDTTEGAKPSTSPEHLNAFEIGLKKDFGRTFQVNAALFYYDYKNDQIPLTVAQTSGGLGQAQSIFFNVPAAKSQGFELESIWQPIDHLQVLFNYSYLDAHVTQGDGIVDPADPAALAPGAKPDVTFAQCQAAVGTANACSTDVFTAGPSATSAGGFILLPNGTFVPVQSVNGAGNGGFQRPQSIVGSHLPNAPKNKVAINVNYTLQFEPGSVTGSVNYVWRDKQFGSLFDRSYYQAPAYDQWDARLTYKDKDNKYTIIAFVKNIFNDLGYEGGAGAGRRAGTLPAYVVGATCPTCNANTAISVLTPGNNNVGNIVSGYLLTPPRTYGVELQYRF